MRWLLLMLTLAFALLAIGWATTAPASTTSSEDCQQINRLIDALERLTPEDQELADPAPPNLLKEEARCDVHDPRCVRHHHRHHVRDRAAVRLEPRRLTRPAVPDDRSETAGAVLAWHVYGYRFGVLVDLGFDLKAAAELARLDHVDLHQAKGLIDRGCDHDTAARILA